MQHAIEGIRPPMDLNNIARLRLAAGSHPAGSGKGCAMNAISYLNGDTEITDFPDCAARPLAAFVQQCNDLLAGPDGYLSPEDSSVALQLALQTIGTAEVSDAVIHAWIADLLADPGWGVIRYTAGAAADAIGDIAELHRLSASGDPAGAAGWSAAERAVHALTPELDVAGRHAVRAAYLSTASVDAGHWMTLDAVTDNALRAHGLATAGTAAISALKLARHAIRSWRRLAELDRLRTGQVAA